MFVEGRDPRVEKAVRREGYNLATDLGVSMKLLLSCINSLVVGGCCAALLVFLGVNLDKRPWWSWVVAALAFSVIWEFAKPVIAKSVADRMGLGEGAD